MEWNFKKLPESEYEKAKKAHKEKDILALLKLHNEYRLSNFDYCCNVDSAMMKWWESGINNNFQ